MPSGDVAALPTQQPPAGFAGGPAGVPTGATDPLQPTQTPVAPTDPAAMPQVPTDPVPPAMMDPSPTGDPAAPADGCALALNECGLDTQWPGDEFCILPPPPDQGFQVHVGPPSYDNPPAQYLVPPGADTNEVFSAVSGNDTDIHYYYRQYRMRPGSHHMILNAAGGAGGGLGGGIGLGRRLGGSSNSAKDNPECGVIAPENDGVGMPLAPRTPISVNLHYFNISDEPALQEVWVNFWYRDPALVKEEAEEMFSMGGLAMAIPPGANTTLGPYACPVSGSGRVLTLYGHYHANTVRFSAWRERAGVRELILEDYDWHDPLILEFASTVENPAPNPAIQSAGGWSGILDLQPGDSILWECEVHNQTDGTLRFANEAVTGEMCILVGDTVGPNVSCTHP